MSACSVAERLKEWFFVVVVLWIEIKNDSRNLNEHFSQLSEFFQIVPHAWIIEYCFCFLAWYLAFYFICVFSECDIKYILMPALWLYICISTSIVKKSHGNDRTVIGIIIGKKWNVHIFTET